MEGTALSDVRQDNESREIHEQVAQKGLEGEIANESTYIALA